MSEDNKPKIDLKARLGKKTVAGVGPSIPPPIAGVPSQAPPAPAAGVPGQRPQGPIPSAGPQRPSGFPAPGAGPAPAQRPAPNLGGPTSIPAPPFGLNPSVPPVQPAAFSAPAVQVAAPQAIKIEMGEEVLQAQKKERSKFRVLAIGTAIVGAIIGIVVGGGMERRKSHNIALEGAKILAGEVDKANEEVEKLADVLKKAKISLGEGKFPEEEVKALGGISIPFDGTYLVGKGIGLMSTDVNRLLVKFAGDSERANEQKDRLQRVLTGMRQPVTELLQEKDEPKVRWGVAVGRGQLGPLASMVLLPEPFLVTSKTAGYKWPSQFELKEGNKTVKISRYEKGDPIESTSPIIPVDPGSQGAVCPSDTLVKLSRELGDLETTLRGDKSDPANERSGLVDTGNALREKLKSVGQ